MREMGCEYEHDIILKALNQLHREILLGNTAAQESGIENLVQIVRYFGSRNSRDTLAEELKNLERAALIMIAGGEIDSCRFPDGIDHLTRKAVERFSAFDECFAALSKGAREGKKAFCIQYDDETERLIVEALDG